jgi:hypothetical protein
MVGKDKELTITHDLIIVVVWRLLHPFTHQGQQVKLRTKLCIPEATIATPPLGQCRWEKDRLHNCLPAVALRHNRALSCWLNTVYVFD